MVMRQPYNVAIVGRDISKAATFRRFMTAPEGVFSETASIDGVRRRYYFKHLPKLPLIIMVAEAEQDIYAAWRHRAVTIGALVATSGAAFIALSVILSGQLRRRMRAESELVLLARTDGLTGLNNRRSFGEVLDREWRRAQRARSVFSLLFVDVDRFKAYNDTLHVDCASVIKQKNVAKETPRGVANLHTPRHAMGLHSARRNDCGAPQVIDELSPADDTGDHGPAIESNTHLEAVAVAQIESRERVQHVQRHAGCPHRMVGDGIGQPGCCHVRIADGLDLFDAAVVGNVIEFGENFVEDSD